VLHGPESCELADRSGSFDEIPAEGATASIRRSLPPWQLGGHTSSLQPSAATLASRHLTGLHGASTSTRLLAPALEPVSDLFEGVRIISSCSCECFSAMGAADEDEQHLDWLGIQAAAGDDRAFRECLCQEAPRTSKAQLDTLLDVLTSKPRAISGKPAVRTKVKNIALPGRTLLRVQAPRYIPAEERVYTEQTQAFGEQVAQSYYEMLSTYFSA